MKIRIGAYIGIIAILLLIPLVAMRHTTEVRWGPLDFLMMGGLLTGVAVIVELSTRKWKTRALNRSYLLAVALMLLAGFFQLWANAAVGIAGAEGNPVNILFYGVVGIAVAGSLVARFEPRGMVYAMLAATAAQLAGALFVWLAGQGMAPVIFTLLLSATWFVAALLFRHAAGHQRTTQG